MIHRLKMTGVLFMLGGLAVPVIAGDLGPKDSTSAGASPAAPSAISVPSPIPGPNPSEQIVPITPVTRAPVKEGTAKPLTPQELDKETQKVEKKLENKNLSKKNRAHLKAKVANLNVKKLSQPSPLLDNNTPPSQP